MADAPLIVLPDLDCTADVVRHHARVRPDAVALVFQDEPITYSELDALSSRCANALISAGVKPGDRVGTLARGNADFFVLWFGCLKAGACLNPVNWRLAPPEVAFILRDAGCRLAVIGADYSAMVEGLAGPGIPSGRDSATGSARTPTSIRFVRPGRRMTSSSSTPPARPACPRASSLPRPTMPPVSAAPAPPGR